jgi:hypothetical protein
MNKVLKRIIRRVLNKFVKGKIEREDSNEDSGEDILCLKIFKKHGYKWAPQYVFPIFREELLHEYNKRTQQVVGGRRTPKFKIK